MSEYEYAPTVHRNKIPAIVSLLVDAAQRHGTVDYPSIYGLFDKVSTKNEQADVWFTFEAACAEICSTEEAIYGALMAVKKTGLPLAGFFSNFIGERGDVYRRIAGDTHPTKLSSEQENEIVEFERARVYAHAAAAKKAGA